MSGHILSRLCQNSPAQTKARATTPSGARRALTVAERRHFACVNWLVCAREQCADGRQGQGRRGINLGAEGRYSVWFKTPVGEGAGMVELGANGQVIGGDTTFSYTGRWEQEGERFAATIAAKRIAAGPPGVFGMDEMDIAIAGYFDGGTPVALSGFAKQSPGLRLEITLVRMRDNN